MAKQVYYWDSLKTRPLQEEFDPIVYQKKQAQGLLASAEDYNAWQQANYDKGFFGDQFADQARASGLYKELSGLTPRDAQGNKIVYSNWAAEAKAILQQHPELLAKYGFNYKPPTAGGEAYVPTEQDFGNAPVVEGQSTTSTPTKLPSGVLVRDATSGRIYLVDNGKKRHITNMDTLNALPADKKYWTDIDVSHLDLPDGSAIDNLLPAAIKSKTDAQKALTDTGINWQEPRGYQQQPTPTQPAPASGKAAESTYDPFAEAAKYGYTKEDFANDPGFLNYWKNKTPDQLKQGLTRRGDFDTRTNKKTLTTQEAADEGLTDEQKQAIQQGHTDIDAMLANGQINEAQAAILHEIFAGEYTSGQNIPTAEEINNIIEQAGINAGAEIGDYYDTMTSQEIEDFKNQMSDITEEARRYGEREAVDYSQKLAQTKQSLRQRGMTFSGMSRKQLGAEGALEAKGIEGQVPGARRSSWEEQEAGYLQRGRDIGIAAERRIGSEAIGNDFGRITTPYGSSDLYNRRGGVTGTLPIEEEAEKRRRQWEKVSAYRSYT